ncbi:NUDIX domain-containing protein [Candidatus Parcubacteria bacterium]|nr:NUDIX domain-containing protein [Candidatus Parcubacteria bacterium]
MEIQNRELHRITSTAIIHKDGKYLIARRALDKKAFPGKWAVPGGGLEVDDYINLPKTTSDIWYFVIEKSLRREIREEVNLEVGKLKYLVDMVFILPSGIPCIILSYYCDYKSGEVKLNEENIDYKWVSYEEAKNYDLVEGLLEEVEMVDQILKGASPDQIEYSKN